VSAAFGAWLWRQCEARGWSRNELARRMADAAGSAVTAPAHVLECYLSRWEAGHVTISARYRQLLDAVLGPGVNARAADPVSVPPASICMPGHPGARSAGGARGCGTEPGQTPARIPAATGELPPGNGLPEFMLVKECAAQLRVSPLVIYGLVRSGHVEAVRLGREFRIHTRSWLAYLQAARPGLRPRREPEGDERDHPPQTSGHPAEPQPARDRPGSAAGRISCSQMSGLEDTVDAHRDQRSAGCHRHGPFQAVIEQAGAPRAFVQPGLDRTGWYAQVCGGLGLVEAGQVVRPGCLPLASGRAS
jgi:excisionase family DNA binding protein